MEANPKARRRTFLRRAEQPFACLLHLNRGGFFFPDALEEHRRPVPVGGLLERSILGVLTKTRGDTTAVESIDRWRDSRDEHEITERPRWVGEQSVEGPLTPRVTEKLLGSEEGVVPRERRT